MQIYISLSLSLCAAHSRRQFGLLIGHIEHNKRAINVWIFMSFPFMSAWIGCGYVIIMATTISRVCWFGEQFVDNNIMWMIEAQKKWEFSMCKRNHQPQIYETRIKIEILNFDRIADVTCYIGRGKTYAFIQEKLHLFHIFFLSNNRAIVFGKSSKSQRHFSGDFW